MSFVITIGRYGGFYIGWGYVKRICLGWIAFDFYPKEIESIIMGVATNAKCQECGNVLIKNERVRI